MTDGIDSCTIVFYLTHILRLRGACSVPILLPVCSTRKQSSHNVSGTVLNTGAIITHKLRNLGVVSLGILVRDQTVT